MRTDPFDRPADAVLDPAVEALLREDFPAPPADFAARVMAALPAVPQPIPPSRAPTGAPAGRGRPFARAAAWLTAVGAGLFGVAQLLSLAFAVWSVTTAG
ncbi:MAG TPA: hypothetical protein PKE01_02970 [Rhodocyclaceae bacterium]|uniref:hypothetical protein n=1 Tax=Zoogloea sp. TaxID=49181 RepID=UPI002CEC414D|nr:hypothetical protein [Zoogloea sp.]HMV62265.1 hypothetical protein [Rhodocyclaceae bacterium]HMZ76000.1 hypothetical protein [Rhodocyclaceae bacterium]HNB63450.1 hypothetical protein [Rhodocyclaceae bacterium]HNC79398.1 hypothetical protein [Rhodocyclaceae bacterium]HND24565.1 hypothetical protein [Rhodocyclaceae bacterium]